MSSDPRVTLPADVKLQSAYIAAPYTTLGVASGMGTQALFGQRFQIFDRRGDFAMGALLSILPDSDRIDYIGLIRARDLSGDAAAPTHTVSVVSAPVFVSPDIKSTIFRFLPRNACVTGTVSGEFLDLGGVGYIHLKHLRLMNESADRDYTDIAADMVGLPYVWGGTGGGGVDCSGLVQSALAAIGVDAPRDADQQEAGLGNTVDYEARGEGDLLFWAGHVGIVIEGDRLLHANAHHMTVTIEPVTEAVARIGDVRTVKRLTL
ncbi:NlpC/P60 family protein [Litorimonas sp. WD9-15]|uniref:C40 family peptidase n=1 Tax=Litorimonas sp. WD9-15 TaxID=3418716 RepID=UPI003D065599